MNAVIRRMAIWHTLCRRRNIRMKELARTYDVTTRTIQLDAEHLSLSHPVETVRGRYNGCVKLPDWYEPRANPINEMQMCFLVKLQDSMQGTDAVILCSIIRAVSGHNNGKL